MRTIIIIGFILLQFSWGQAQDSLSTAEWFRTQSLVEMCDTFPTDKCPDRHGFVEIYEPLFEPIRDDSVRIFEIGILRGLSHLMWRNYFQNGEIYGIDLKDYSAVAAKDGINTFVADQSNRDDLDAFIEYSGGNFDVILDDGGHAMDHQQVSLGHLFSEVKPGGIFIIEDVHTSLPDIYKDEAFKVNETETNTTLMMLETFVRTGKIYSDYMTPEEVKYLENNIERVAIHYRRNVRHSIVCVIHKKESAE